MNTFLNDLPYGISGEARVTQFFHHNYGWTFQPVFSGCREQYDYVATKDGREVKIEIKTDKRSEQTGYFFVETGNRDGTNPSGLLTSKAAVYYYLMPDSGRIVGINKRKLLTLVYGKAVKRVFHPTHGVLIPVETCIEFGKEYQPKY